MSFKNKIEYQMIIDVQLPISNRAKLRKVKEDERKYLQELVPSVCVCQFQAEDSESVYI